VTPAMQAGLTGLAIGLIVGLCQYALTVAAMSMTLRRSVAEAEAENEELPGVAALGRAVQKIKLAMMGVAIVVYPAAGFVLGRYLAA